MITRLESCTKEQSPRLPDRHRLFWDITLGLCAAGYLALVLFDGVESPLFSLALIAVVGYKLVQPRLRNR